MDIALVFLFIIEYIKNTLLTTIFNEIVNQAFQAIKNYVNSQYKYRKKL